MKWTFLFALMCLLAPASAQSLKPSFSEQADLHAKLKTAYLFNTAKFVTWAEDKNTVSLCLRGQSATPKLASKLDGRALGDGRKLSVGYEIDSQICDIVFDDDSATEEERKSLLQQLDAENVLLISDGSHAITMGYTMQFFIQADSVRFALNSDQLKQAKFKVSSKLRRLARKPSRQ